MSIVTCRGKAQIASRFVIRLRQLASRENDQQFESSIAGAEQKSKKREEYERILEGLVQRNPEEVEHWLNSECSIPRAARKHRFAGPKSWDEYPSVSFTEHDRTPVTRPNPATIKS